MSNISMCEGTAGFHSNIIETVALAITVSAAPVLEPAIHQCVSYIAKIGFEFIGNAYQSMQTWFDNHAEPCTKQCFVGDPMPPPCVAQPVWFDQNFTREVESVERDPSSSLEEFVYKVPKLFNEIIHYHLDLYDDLGFFRLKNGHFEWSQLAPTSSETAIKCKKIWQVYLPKIHPGVSDIDLTFVRKTEIEEVGNQQGPLKDRFICLSLKQEIIFANFVQALRGSLPISNVYSSHIFANFDEFNNFDSPLPEFDFAQVNNLSEEKRNYIAKQLFTVCSFVKSEKTRFSGSSYADLSAVVVGRQPKDGDICSAIFARSFAELNWRIAIEETRQFKKKIKL